MSRWVVILLCLLQPVVLKAQEGTVVCIHGFLSSSMSMRPIAKTLAQDGFRICNWNYPSRRYTLETHACHLVSYLQQIAYCYPSEPIHFVTHSIGGIILRIALNLPGCPPEALSGKAALLAPPNQGSQFARRFADFAPASLVAGSESGWELMHYGPCDVQALGAFPETVQVLVIAGTQGDSAWFCEPNDGFVTVNETALETPCCWTSFPVKHGGLLTHPPVLSCLRSFFYWGFVQEEAAPPAEEESK